MKIKKIQDEKLEGKKIILRVDYNVNIKEGKVQDKYKIETSKKTIQYILSKKNTKLALVSHLGRPGEGGVNIESGFLKSFSFRQIVEDISEVLGVKVRFLAGYGKELIDRELESLEEGEVLLLENIRFFKEEEENDEYFARNLARSFDLYVNEAFSNSHRKHASMVGITKFLPAVAGFRLQEEIEVLEKIQNYPEHPAVAIIGGAKIETKLPLIERFSKNYDYVLVGGKVANEAMDQNIKFNDKVILPLDLAENRLDIGKETIAKFKSVIKQAETIVWNGPLGKFEEAPFDTGTREIVNAIIESGAYSVSGGGESIQVLEEMGKMNKMSFVSTGGGAMLEFLSGEAIPGLEILK